MSKDDQNSTVGKFPSRDDHTAEADGGLVASILSDKPSRWEVVDALVALDAELDDELGVLRTPDAANRLRAVFEASPADFANAANSAAKRHKR
jgi:hypothetical protein